MLQKIRAKFRATEQGQGLVEYALLLVLMALVVLGALLLMGPEIGKVYSRIIVQLQRTGLITDNSGIITSIDAYSLDDGAGGYDLYVDIEVSGVGNVTITPENLSARTVSCSPPACTTEVFNGALPNGQVTVSDDQGGAGYTFSWAPQ
jgi:pilus assembly protein Flp/PilA